MRKTLIKLDDTYREVVSKQNLQSRVDYCNKVIDRSHKTLLHNGSSLSSEQKQELINLITAAQKEIKSIR